MRRKVSIIGAGFVGSTAAYSLLISGACSEIVLIDVNKQKAKGEAMDLKHGMQFVHQSKIRFGEDYRLCKGSSIVIICAGAGQKPGETRLDLVKKNAAIFKDMIPKITKHCKDCILLVVSNPVDVLTYIAMEYSGFPPERVFGTGTVLDTARLRYHLGEHYNVSASSVHAYILGEHGDSEFPVWSSARIGGAPLKSMKEYSKNDMDRIAKETKNAAYEIITTKGATYYAIGLVITKIVKAVFSDSNEVMPVSTRLDGYYGIRDVCLSVPCVVGSNGIDKQLLIPLNATEKRSLRKSANILRSTIKEVMVKK
ncbi:MAG: L-lactate dehydrogenase [Candidatus Aenigmatarchaeota archaeon]|nr:MAG: L-lactate dehydrogenase [Candidatus Aenigmarchaeota archaeon]